MDPSAIGIALGALALAGVVALLVMPKRPADEALASKVRQLDADLDDLFDRMKRLTARKGMAAKRAEDAARSPTKPRDDETPAQWKARMKKDFPNGIPHEE